MSRLQISYTHNGESRAYDTPPPKPDNSWHGVRQFWVRAHDGAFKVDYDLGVTQAQEDIDLDQTTNREALLSTNVADRDKAWEARRDGFEDTLRKHDGTTLR